MLEFGDHWSPSYALSLLKIVLSHTKHRSVDHRSPSYALSLSKIVLSHTKHRSGDH